MSHKTKLLKEYMESQDKEGSGADYMDIFRTEEFNKYREDYGFEKNDQEYKEIYTGVIHNIMTGKLREEDLDIELREKLKRLKELRLRRERVGLEVICHPTLTKWLSGSKDQDRKINWFDLELVSAISQAMRLSNCKDYVISIEWLYMLIYGRGFSRSSMKEEFLKKVKSSLEGMEDIVTGSFDDNGLGHLIETPVLLDAKKEGDLTETQVLLDAKKRGNFVKIPVECIGESRCKMQDVKNYLLYTYFQKNYKYGKINDKKRKGRFTLRTTMVKHLGWEPDDEMMRKVFKSLENDGFNAGFEIKNKAENTNCIEVTKNKEGGSNE